MGSRYVDEHYPQYQEKRSDANLMRGLPVQVRVEEGKEPPHFHAIFQGTMVLHQLYRPTDASLATVKEGQEGTRLFLVSGTTDYNIRCVIWGLAVPSYAVYGLNYFNNVKYFNIV